MCATARRSATIPSAGVQGATAHGWRSRPQNGCQIVEAFAPAGSPILFVPGWRMRGAGNRGAWYRIRWKLRLHSGNGPGRSADTEQRLAHSRNADGLPTWIETPVLPSLTVGMRALQRTHPDRKGAWRAEVMLLQVQIPGSTMMLDFVVN